MSYIKYTISLKTYCNYTFISNTLQIFFFLVGFVEKKKSQTIYHNSRFTIAQQSDQQVRPTLLVYQGGRVLCSVYLNV